MSLSALPGDWYYLLLAMLLFAGVVLLIPRRYIRTYFPAAILLGSGTSFFFNMVFGQLLKSLSYVGHGAFHVFGGPFWILFAWTPAIMLFLHFLPRRESTLLRWAYIAAWSVFSMSLDILLHQLGLLQYIHWGPWQRFLVAMVWFGMTARFARYLLGGHEEEREKAKGKRGKGEG